MNVTSSSVLETFVTDMNSFFNFLLFNIFIVIKIWWLCEHQIKNVVYSGNILKIRSMRYKRTTHHGIIDVKSVKIIFIGYILNEFCNVSLHNLAFIIVKNADIIEIIWITWKLVYWVDPTVTNGHTLENYNYFLIFFYFLPFNGT